MIHSFWGPVRFVRQTGSTNADVAAAARDGAPEGLVIHAGEQTSGRGRLAREWSSPPGSSLSMSVLLRPVDVAVSRWTWLPLLVGVAVADAVRSVSGVSVGLKWPNDVLVDDRKLAGILVERVETEGGPAVVAGIGLNVSVPAADLPPGAVSLDTRSSARLTREDVLAAVLHELAAGYLRWREAEGSAAAWLAAAYTERCVTLGQDVHVSLPGARTVVGRAVAIDEEGRLVVDGPEGRTAVGAGDVVHVRPAG